MKLTLLIIALLFTARIFAQGVLQIEQPSINLDHLPADDKPTLVTFKAKNTGNQPVLIIHVTPISGHMFANWDKSPIMPGQTRDINISFTSSLMPERFNYSVMVYSNASNSRIQLNVGAQIVENPKKPELLYKYSMDGIKLKKSSVDFNNIYTWQVVSDTIGFINPRTDSISISVQYMPSHIRLVSIPAKVAPGKRGQLIFTYDASKKNDYGYIYESVILSVNNTKNYTNRLSVTANLIEDFSKLNARELSNAPVANFDKTEINFGEIKQGEKTNCDFTLTNNGKSNLVIRKTRASCGCTAVALGENSVAPGKSTVIRATFDSANKSGRQYKSITIITNDPKNPEKTLTISGNIK